MIVQSPIPDVYPTTQILGVGSMWVQFSQYTPPVVGDSGTAVEVELFGGTLRTYRLSGGMTETMTLRGGTGRTIRSH